MGCCDCLNHILSAPVHGVYISPLVRYSRIGDQYSDFLCISAADATSTQASLLCYYADDIATAIIRSSSRTG